MPRPEDAPDFWVPAPECAEVDPSFASTLYCDGAEDCASGQDPYS
jgi:hypothetical protein